MDKRSHNLLFALVLTLSFTASNGGSVSLALADDPGTKPAAPEEAGTITDNAPMSDLDRFAILEKRYFGHNYASDTIEDRLFRLEHLVFGSKTVGSLPVRIKKLESSLGSATPTAAVQANPALNPGEPTQPVLPANAPVAAQTPVKEVPKTFNGLYTQAMNDIDASRFHAASEELEQAIQLNPNSAKAYSLLASTLIKLQDREGAKEAYRACFQVDPFGPDGRNAKAMLLKMVQDDTVRATAPQDTPEVVAHTMRTLNMEAADLANRYRQDGNRWASYRRYLGSIEVNKIQMENNQYMNGYGGGGGFGFRYNNGRFNGFGGGGGGMSSAARREISDMGRLQSNYIRTDSIVQANKARYEAAMKSASIMESTANLKAQILSAKVLKDDAQLKALGTSLYCRYYGDETPSIDEPPVPEDPVLELRARALTLNSH